MEGFRENNESMEELYNEMFSMIEIRKKSLHTAVNSELVSLYWNIGRALKTEMAKNATNGYAMGIVEELSEELTAKYGRGYNVTNLLDMVRFYELYTDYDLVSALSTQLTWSHFLELIEIDDNLERNFYINNANNERWSAATLRFKINSGFYEKNSKANKPREAITARVQMPREVDKMPAEMFFRDQHIIDFLGMQDYNLENKRSIASSHLVDEAGTSQGEVLDYLLGSE